MKNDTLRPVPVKRCSKCKGSGVMGWGKHNTAMTCNACGGSGAATFTPQQRYAAQQSKDHVTLKSVPVGGETELQYTAKDSALSTGFLGACIALLAYVYRRKETASPSDYDLNTYQPERRTW